MKPPSKYLPLLLEVGCEEIPARFLADAEKQLGERLRAALDAAQLLPADTQSSQGAPLRTYSTPRRLVACVPRVLEKQLDKQEEILGPPVKVSFDAEGKPTRAAESFAQKNGVQVKALIRTTTPKGEYLAVRKTTQGRPARELLPDILLGAITGMSFPKSMYWVAKAGPRFVRPIRWVLTLLGEGKQAKVIPLEIAGVKSGNSTFGHRALRKGGIPVNGFTDYAKKLLAAHVEIDPAKRRARVLKESQVLLEKNGLTTVQDEALMDWIVNSTEWPRSLLGNFDARFLSLPREILVTVMRDHQKYFAVEDRKGQLRPHFVAVLNMDADTKGLIRQGHERVLAARFSDAEFFWKTDQRVSLEGRQELLARVTYQEDLGSYGEKVRRTREVARELVRLLGEAGKINHADAAHALRAVDLAKCDLTTQMVQEFTELQGVVGGLYARAQGEPPEVAEAIYDHYRPLGPEDACPRSIVGAVVALADKLDSVAGGFALGQEPTGSSDPFALRRQGNGIIKVLLEFRLPLALRPLVEQALNVLDIEWRRAKAEVFERVNAFFLERLRYYLESFGGLRYDTVRAVLAAGGDAPLDALERGKALEAIRGSENVVTLFQAAKRIKNILTKSATGADWEPGEIAEGLLREPQEQELYAAYREVAEGAARGRLAGDYRKALESIATLRPAVDKFFDKVLVMAEDRELRRNRLRLLGQLDALFSGIAIFAELAGEGKS